MVLARLTAAPRALSIGRFNSLRNNDLSLLSSNLHWNCFLLLLLNDSLNAILFSTPNGTTVAARAAALAEVAGSLIVRVNHVGWLLADGRVNFNSRNRDVSRINRRLHEVGITDIREGSLGVLGRLGTTSKLSGILVRFSSNDEGSEEDGS